jgi:hypothetical protein
MTKAGRKSGSTLMGPTCEVLLNGDLDDVLDGIDRFLARVCDVVHPTRKGRFWSVRIDGRPIELHVIDFPLSVVITAFCNDPIDYRMLRLLGSGLAEEFDGLASEPTK